LKNVFRHFPIYKEPHFSYNDACTKLKPLEYQQLLYEYDSHDAQSQYDNIGHEHDNLGVRDDAGKRYLMRMKIQD